MPSQVIVRGVPASLAPEAFNVWTSTQVDPTQLSADLETFYTDCEAVFQFGAEFTIEPIYRVFDPVSGDTTGVGTLGGGALWSVTGTGNSVMLPESTSLCVNWHTAEWVGGREIRGRTFLPWIAQGLGSGEPSSGTRTILNDAGAGLVAGDLGVWSRKNGLVRSATSASASTEYAVMRKRRS